MAEAIINRIRNSIRSLNYAVSIHAAEELDDKNLTVLDLEGVEAVVKIPPDGTLFVVTVYRA